MVCSARGVRTLSGGAFGSDGFFPTAASGNSRPLNGATASAGRDIAAARRRTGRHGPAAPGSHAEGSSGPRGQHALSETHDARRPRGCRYGATLPARDGRRADGLLQLHRTVAVCGIHSAGTGSVRLANATDRGGAPHARGAGRRRALSHGGTTVASASSTARSPISPA